MNKLILQGIILAVIVSAFSAVIYQWHYKPLKNFKVRCLTKDEYIKQYKFSIKNLKQKLENEKVKLQKCKDDANVEVFETEFDTLGNSVDDLYSLYLKGDKNEQIKPSSKNDKKQGVSKYRFDF